MRKGHRQRIPHRRPDRDCGTADCPCSASSGRRGVAGTLYGSPKNGEKAWFGWPKDDEIEALRKAWLKATDSEVRQEIAAKIRARLRNGALHPDRTIFAEERLPQNLRSVIKAPALFIWNVEKV
jgi:hypothetical protein